MGGRADGRGLTAPRPEAEMRAVGASSRCYEQRPGRGQLAGPGATLRSGQDAPAVSSASRPTTLSATPFTGSPAGSLETSPALPLTKVSVVKVLGLKRSNAPLVEFCKNRASGLCGKENHLPEQNLLEL